MNTSPLPDLAYLLPEIVRIAKGAGQNILSIYQKTDHSIEHKTDNSPLTAADLASHHYIIQQLSVLTPNYPVLSEESAHLPYEERAHWETYWLVDPLDGTKEFIKRNGEFSVLIALIHQHQSILGVVHAPVLQTTWYAAKGLGAHRQLNHEPPSLLATRQTPDKVTIVGSRSHAGDSLKNLLDRIGNYELVSMGSILKACMVAEGKADLYPRLGPTSEWDTAAAQIIVEEAGGDFVTLPELQPLRYNQKQSLLNSEFLVSGVSASAWQKIL